MFSNLFLITCSTFHTIKAIYRITLLNLLDFVEVRIGWIIHKKGSNPKPAYAAVELHRSRPWALYWLDRFPKEGIDVLRDKTSTKIEDDQNYQLV
jgi:hypothetical protein